MKGVLTSYPVGSHKYSSYILGSTLTQIKKKKRLRNIQENIESTLMDINVMPDYSSLPIEEFESRIEEILHTACFLSFIALKAKTLKIEDILGDKGVIHEISHYLIEKNKKSLIRIRDLITSLQENAIGFYEPV